MMAETAPRAPLSQNEAAALGVAVLGHAALLAALIWFKPADLPPPPPERMAVTISDDSALVSTTPDPQADPAQDSGPVLGDMVPPPVPEPVEVAQVQPRPVPALVPRPQARPIPPTPRPTSKPTISPSRNNRKPSQRPGSQSVENDLDNTLGKRGPGKGTPAQATGAQQNAWQNSVASRVQSPWQRCPVSGLDLEKLRIVIPFTLGRDGSVLSFGEPRISGVTPANRNQVEPFKSCAVRAIKLAGTFSGLPPEYYDQWKSRELTFSKGRAQ